MMRRIIVIGTTGSGKTAMARAIAERLAIPHVELDALNWGPDWTEVPREVFRQRVREAVAGTAWVVDGNYSKSRDIVWPRAETAVWLDFPLWVILWRLTRRTIARTLTREELWSGNRERFRTALLSRNSLFVWALQTYQRRRRGYPELLHRQEHAHLTVVRLRALRDAASWLDRLDYAPLR
ncbi:MAG: AAA family ATPase [bacterium]